MSEQQNEAAAINLLWQVLCKSCCTAQPNYCIFQCAFFEPNLTPLKLGFMCIVINRMLDLCFVAEGLLGRSGFRLKLFV